MIITEIVGNSVHTYSDRDVYIYGGSPEGYYEDAFDPIDSGRTYSQTNIPLPEPEAKDIVDILIGEE